MGYAPFLGQVRLAKRSLGQALMEWLPEAEAVLAEYNDLVRQAEAADRRDILETYYGAPVRTLRDAVSVDVSAARAGEAWIAADLLTGEPQARLNSLTNLVRDFKQTLSTPAPAGRVSLVPEGVPAWAYVIGGLAAAGLVAYAVTR